MKSFNKENKGLNTHLNKSFKSVAELLDTRNFRVSMSSVKTIQSKDTDTPNKMNKMNKITIKDLCPEDKQKIGDLIQKLAQEKREKTELIEKFKQEKQELRDSISTLTRNHQVLVLSNIGIGYGE